MEKAEMQETDLTDILEKTVLRYESLLSDKELSITFECDEHVFVACDVTKITQVINNLVDNAVNYANFPKTVKLSQVFNEKDKTVRVEISDNGDGIEPDMIPHIWNRYYKVDKKHTRAVAGSGLGLSIVSKLLQIHSAEYGVETSASNGTTFWFSLKLLP
jgi:signal transduction histidine kinase